MHTGIKQLIGRSMGKQGGLPAPPRFYDIDIIEMSCKHTMIILKEKNMGGSVPKGMMMMISSFFGSSIHVSGVLMDGPENKVPNKKTCLGRSSPSSIISR